MPRLLNPARNSLIRVRSMWQASTLSYPKRVECNVCGWSGRRFLSTPWHRAIQCPVCRTSVRQRLFVAALERLGAVSYARVIDGKRVLHFAPERVLGDLVARRARSYRTADYLIAGVDLQLDISAMPEIADGSVDVVIAFDVLEHVEHYRRALREIRRTLAPAGFAILTVPQVDHLATTLEDPSVTTPEERAERFGQWDHLRLFGDDFAGIVADHGFAVTAVDEKAFPVEVVQRHVLFPPVLSTRRLATNYRQVYFCQAE